MSAKLSRPVKCSDNYSEKRPVDDKSLSKEKTKRLVLWKGLISEDFLVTYAKHLIVPPHLK